MTQIQREFENVIQDAEMRKTFPTLEEQMDKLAPELQVELHKIEEIYDREIQMARKIRREIIETTNDLFEANMTCSQLINAAMKERHTKIKQLQDIWGKFFYNNSR